MATLRACSILDTNEREKVFGRGNLVGKLGGNREGLPAGHGQGFIGIVSWVIKSLLDLLFTRRQFVRAGDKILASFSN